MPEEAKQFLTDLRPAEIILAYWRERIVIEENAELLNPEYMEAQS